MFTTSNSNKEFILKALLGQQRIDGRKLLDYRKIKVHFGLQYGVVELELGCTHILAKTCAEIVEPRPEKPNEGILKFKVDLSIIQEEAEKTNLDSKKLQTEISKLLEKIIKESKAIDTESLKLINGKKVWQISTDIQLINNDGNIIDATYLASIISLLHFKLPSVTIESKDFIKVYDYTERRPEPLSIHHIPISFTFCLFQENKAIVIDPLREEELVMDGRVTITINIYKDICSIHKPGGAPINQELLSQMIDISIVKVNQMTQFIRDLIKRCDKFSILNIKEESKVEIMDFSKVQEQSDIQNEKIIAEISNDLQNRVNQQLQQ